MEGVVLMNYLSYIKRSVVGAWLGILFLAFGQAASFGASEVLEGQNKGDTNTWSAGNLANWQELD